MSFHYSKTTGGFYVDDVHEDIPADAMPVSDEEHAALMAQQEAGKVIVGNGDGAPVAITPLPRAPTPAELQAALEAAVQRHLDATAQTLGYDSIASAVSYADEPIVPSFEAQGKAFRAWRSQVWAACIATLAAVTAGTQTAPTAAALIASLPAFVAP